jgi:hypothetical protein
MAIPNGVIFIWSGTHASIPAGWSRVTDLDSKFPRVIDIGDAINATGGSTTHTHTSPGHTHTMDAHTHTFSLSGTSGPKDVGGGGSNPGIRDSHNHGTTTSGAANDTTSSSVTVTYSSISNNPPYYEVIFITPATSAGGLPNLALTLIDGTDLKNLSLCDGTNLTPDLTTKFLKGATTSADAGGTGGSTTNTHTIAHTHTQLHSHSAVTTAAADSQISINSGGDAARNGHTHLVGLNAATLTTNTNSAISSQAETVIPPYVDLVIGQNRTGNSIAQPGIVGMWLGLEANIPANFEATTKHGRLIRGSSIANNGNTGGSATHTHAAQSHSHTSSGHTHTTGDVYHSADVRDSSGSSTYTLAASYHPSQNSSAVSPSFSATNTTADSSNNMPEYRNVLLIKYKGETGGGFLFNLL